MKLLVFISICLLYFTIFACHKGKSETNADMKAALDTAHYTLVKWMDSTVQFGSIHKGEHITVRFRCKNIGNEPLILVDVRPVCGCTVADYTKHPIMPGLEGIIEAALNSEHVPVGNVRKTIIVNTNTKNGTEHYLFFEGQVVADSATILKF
ncbi:DUF1573 domain-containing protein [Hydrotalea sp.]|uniref:DUF1573 domain-containing protein n=1 Tax=Hydrotalea sp. TaxID=2881279 RepID=UPI00260EF5FA|nr:DUF1573 domain-containing protein [Hydrotalea sp.]